MVLLVGSIAMAFSVGNRVIVIDVNSPYYLKIGVVTAVTGVNTVRFNTINEPIFVDFLDSQLKIGPNVTPKK